MNSKTTKKIFGFENPFIADPLSKKAYKFCKGGGRLLDIGCGEGADSVFFAKKDFQVTSIDANKNYLKPFRKYCRHENLTNIKIQNKDVINYAYPKNYYDVVISYLVICCMKKSQFEKLLKPVKEAVKPGGIIIISSRNYLDPDYKEFLKKKMVEPNTFRRENDQCSYAYFIEKDRLKKCFSDFEILYYYEGLAPCKYETHDHHGDSYIISRKI